MDRKSLSITELEDILQKIKTVLTEAGLPKGSVEIKFKSTNELDIECLNNTSSSKSSLPPGCTHCNGELCCTA